MADARVIVGEVYYDEKVGKYFRVNEIKEFTLEVTELTSKADFTFTISDIERDLNAGTLYRMVGWGKPKGIPPLLLVGGGLFLVYLLFSKK